MGLVSKSTLQNLGYKLEVGAPSTEWKSPEAMPRKNMNNFDNDVSLIDESPLPSILKKPSKAMSKKLETTINQSRVEISPGLFVKRPSSKNKKARGPCLAYTSGSKL